MNKCDLLDFGYFVDNEYLDKYIELITNNINSKRIVGVTQCHHIIPSCYSHLKGVPVVDKTCNLTFKDHIIAHYYLSLCCDSPQLIADNMYSISFMTNNKNCSYVSQSWLEENLQRLQERYEYVRNNTVNPMKIDQHKCKHDNVMRSDTVRKKISFTIHSLAEAGMIFDEEHRKHLSEARTGKIYVYNNSEEHVISPSDLEHYLSLGYKRGQRKSKDGRNNHEGKICVYNGSISKFIDPNELCVYEQQGFLRGRCPFTDETKRKMSVSHKGKSPANKGVPMSEEQKAKLRSSFTGRKWMNNGIIQKQVKKEEVDQYIQQGFVYGKLTRVKGGDVNE